MGGVAVVTGAWGGIGNAVVRRLNRDGWTVFGLDAPNRADPAETLVEADLQLAEEARCARFLPFDLRLWRELPDALADLVATEPVDLLVNNAGVQHISPIDQFIDSALEETFAVNTFAPFVAVRALAETLARTRGSVVNIASVHSVATSQGMSAYAASKSAMVGMTRAAAIDLASAGVRVNAVLPGAVETPMLRAGLAARKDRSEAAQDRLARGTPLGRIGSPDEVAELCAFLADGARSGFITGQCFTLDGGALARLGTE
jgi:NAD(P)-dependent dehydrogenase (short-subunit alcohol dehydrogenase family)